MGKFKITKDTKDIHCRVKIGSNPEVDGTIIRQKSSKRFLVTDGKTNGICTVSNLEENEERSNTMTLTVEKQDGTLQRVEYLSNKFAMDFDKNRFIITGATTDAHENATVLTDEAKAKLAKPIKKKVVKKKKKAVKKAPTKKPVAKKEAKKAPTKRVINRKDLDKDLGDSLFDFKIIED
jgi:uridylate kinase